jgi:hypothetical protein
MEDAMSHYRIEDEFETTPERYWEVFFDEDYNAKLFEHLEVDRKQLEFRREGEGDDEVIHRVVTLTPRREVPAVMKKIVKTAISYEERNVFRRAKNMLDVVTVPNFMADKVTTEGKYFLETRGTNRIVRVWDGVCECRVPFVGGKVEKHLIDEIKRGYAATTIFTRKWLADHSAP